jgi:hypothetical protein
MTARMTCLFHSYHASAMGSTGNRSDHCPNTRNRVKQLAQHADGLWSINGLFLRVHPRKVAKRRRLGHGPLQTSIELHDGSAFVDFFVLFLWNDPQDRVKGALSAIGSTACF